MKNITRLLLFFVFLGSLDSFGYQQENQVFGVTNNWSISNTIGYEGPPNFCSAVFMTDLPLISYLPNVTTEYFDYSTTEYFLNETLYFGNTPYCNVTLMVYWGEALNYLNISVNYSVQGTQNKSVYWMGTYADYFVQGEDYYGFNTSSLNVEPVAHGCGNVYKCTVEVINTTNNESLHIQQLADQELCNLTYHTYTLFLNYTEKKNNGTIHGYYTSNSTFTDSNQTFFPGFKEVGITGYSPTQYCEFNTSYYCTAYVRNNSNNETLVIQQLADKNNNCLNLNAGELPINGGGLGNMTKIGSSVLGMSSSTFLKIAAIIICGVIMTAIASVNQRLGVVLGVAGIDFVVLIGGWVIVPISLLSVVNFIAILCWYSDK